MLVQLSDSDTLLMGQTGSIRLYYKPSWFGSYEDDKNTVLSKLKEASETPGSLLSKLQFLVARNVIQPAPEDESYGPYIEVDYKVVKNPIPIIAIVVAVGAVVAVVAAGWTGIKVFVNKVVEAAGKVVEAVGDTAKGVAGTVQALPIIVVAVAVLVVIYLSRSS